MLDSLKVGDVLEFNYNGKKRFVEVREMGPTRNCRADAFIGWDYNADYPTGGYRQFVERKMQNVVGV